MEGIRKALCIDGWMTTEELMWLALQAHDHKVIVEVGSWKGRSTKVLSYYTKGIVYSIDSWEGPSNIAEFQDSYREVINNGSDFVYQQFCSNMEKEIKSNKVRPIKTYSDVALGILKGLNIIPDMIFIDADHSYEPFKKDLIGYARILGDGGLLCGHDYCYIGVQQALHDTYPLERICTQNNIWWIE
jgi:hypothetical protein